MFAGGAKTFSISALSSTGIILVPVSIPTSSSSWIGPTGKPNLTSASSMTSIGLAFRQQAHRFVDVRREDTVHIEPRFICDHNRRFALPFRQLHHGGDSLRVGSLACGITSTSGIFSTGLKKCRPITCPGRLACAAISPIGNDEVFDAKMVCGPPYCSTSPTIRCLRARSSNTASITTSR